MNASRRDVLKRGLAALGFSALPGGALFAAPRGWKPPKKPNLVFGVLSDTHLQSGWDGVRPHRGFPLKYVTNAMKLFRDRNIDAFVHLGDAAHRGKNVEAQYHRDIFDTFFPNGRAKDGHKVEKLLVVGNHELYGNAAGGPGAWAANIWKDPVERKKHVLCGDLPKHWEMVWGEKYEEVWHKVVKGYHFFGRHWGVDEMRLANLVNESAASCGLSGKKPFFILSHRRHHFKCNHAMRAFPNAIAFFGHWHQSNADWKTIYFNNFGGFFPNIQVGACRMDGGNSLDSNESVLKIKADEDERNWHSNKQPSRQGMIVNVYDDMVVFERHEFGVGGKLGSDWVLPLGWGTGNGERGTGKHPFSREELTKAIGMPQFPPKAKVEATKTDDGNLKLVIPLADGNPDSRVFAYDVVVVGDNLSERLFKSVYFEGCNVPVGREPDSGRTVLSIPVAQLPTGKTLTIAVRPISSLGTRGKAIAVKFKV